MRERPILFSGPMVRAILEGRKTQTRRVVSNGTSQGNFRASELLLDDPRTFVDRGPSPAGNPGQYLHAYVDAMKIETARGWKRGDCDADVVERLYPRWFPGDRLWVKESIRHLGTYINGALELDESVYVADGEQTVADAWPWKLKTLPGMFCPKGLSRLTLEVKAVRVERLQEISEADAIAEGCVTSEVVSGFDGAAVKVPTEVPHLSGVGASGWDTARDWYADLWDSINANRGHSWESNPWVWVVEFERAPL